MTKEKALQEQVKAIEILKTRTLSTDRNWVNLKHMFNDGTITKTRHSDIANNGYTDKGFSCILPFWYMAHEGRRVLQNEKIEIHHAKGRIPCLKMAVAMMKDNEGLCCGHKIDGILNGTPNLIGAPRHSRAMFNYLNITALDGSSIKG